MELFRSLTCSPIVSTYCSPQHTQRPLKQQKDGLYLTTMVDLKSLMYLGIRIDQTPASPCNSTVWPTKFEMEGQHHHHRHFDTLMARVSQSFLFTPHS
jgi:hypothetical protein